MNAVIRALKNRLKRLPVKPEVRPHIIEACEELLAAGYSDFLKKKFREGLKVFPDCQELSIALSIVRCGLSFEYEVPVEGKKPDFSVSGFGFSLFLECKSGHEPKEDKEHYKWIKDLYEWLEKTHGAAADLEILSKGLSVRNVNVDNLVAQIEQELIEGKIPLTSHYRDEHAEQTIVYKLSPPKLDRETHIRLAREPIFYAGPPRSEKWENRLNNWCRKACGQLPKSSGVSIIILDPWGIPFPEFRQFMSNEEFWSHESTNHVDGILVLRGKFNCENFEYEHQWLFLNCFSDIDNTKRLEELRQRFGWSHESDAPFMGK